MSLIVVILALLIQTIYSCSRTCAWSSLITCLSRILDASDAIARSSSGMVRSSSLVKDNVGNIQEYMIVIAPLVLGTGYNHICLFSTKYSRGEPTSTPISVLVVLSSSLFHSLSVTFSIKLISSGKL